MQVTTTGIAAECWQSLSPVPPSELEKYFQRFRSQIIGIGHTYASPEGETLPLVYADWTASGRGYAPMETKMAQEVLPWVANTHTETNITGKTMTRAYDRARQIVKQQVNACAHDLLIMTGSGMTGAVNKLQRIMGLKKKGRALTKVLISHMEHHSNQLSWQACAADVEVIKPDSEGLVSLAHFEAALQDSSAYAQVIVSVTACSNVTGIENPVHQLAVLAHKYKALIMVDYACSAPYVTINMNASPSNGDYFDAIFFSPHKFLGGVGTSGVLLMKENLHQGVVPDHPGGGTVKWTNPWGGFALVDDKEAQEDGGTPPFLQTIRVAMAMTLKQEMGVARMHQREAEQLNFLLPRLATIPGLHILGGAHRTRLGIISFYIADVNYNAVVQLLNDGFGIQVRGGCSCAGTYGHFLLAVDQQQSQHITNAIDHGDYSSKPGWVRLSIHPTHTFQELAYMAQAIAYIAKHHRTLLEAYDIDANTLRLTPKRVVKHPAMEVDELRFFSF